ncbi:MAG: hydrogenase maturation protease [Chitinophagaceae bacterium]|jgi:hydrogenase maturation protease|nr:hydrogenase maturation protease [Chitinophagaceae bacterium]
MHAPETSNDRLLVIGIGNEGRGDDGLGWRFAQAVSQLSIEGLDVEWRYQLQVEDALLICRYPSVVFVDASHQHHPGGYAWNSCFPAGHYFFSSHVQSPETILYLCRELYQQQPEAWILSITGLQWDLHVGLSTEASGNLGRALDFFSRLLQEHPTLNTSPAEAT